MIPRRLAPFRYGTALYADISAVDGTPIVGIDVSIVGLGSVLKVR